MTDSQFHNNYDNTLEKNLYFFNPYELLDVTTNSTPDAVKRKYYDLAILVHPDKSGNPEDMIALKKSYDFVMREISQTNREVTYEDMEEKFDKFCALQENKIPEFTDIYNLTHDVPRPDYENFNEQFNKAFTSCPNDDASTPGYGDVMEKSEYKVDIEASNDSISDKFKKLFKNLNNSNFTTANSNSDTTTTNINDEISHKFDYITPYTAPISQKTKFNHLQTIPNHNSSNSGITDYSLDNMTDYKLAFTDAVKDPRCFIDPVKDVDALDKLLNARKDDDLKNDKNFITDIKWGLSGMVDEDGNEISDMKLLNSRF
jgi:hypothetical protein